MMKIDEKNIQTMIDNGIAINPETGDFDLSVLPIKEQNKIKKLATSFLKKEAFVKQAKKKIRVKKPRHMVKIRRKNRRRGLSSPSELNYHCLCLF